LVQWIRFLAGQKLVSKTERNENISCLKELFEGLKCSPPLNVLFRFFFKAKYGIFYNIFLALKPLSGPESRFSKKPGPGVSEPGS
jgi:hypothetical protein